jgi:hypothetical protein
VEGQIVEFISLRNRVSQLYPRALNCGFSKSKSLTCSVGPRYIASARLKGRERNLVSDIKGGTWTKGV